MATGAFKSLVEAEAEFFRYLGRAVTLWAQVDEEMFHLCADILKIPERRVAIVFYQSSSINARINLIDDLIGTLFPDLKSGEHSDPLLMEWQAILKAIRAEYPTRNQLAHSPAAPRVEVTGANHDESSGFWILNTEAQYVSYMSDTEKHRGKTIKPDLTLGKIGNHIGNISRAINRLRTFRTSLSPRHL